MKSADFYGAARARRSLFHFLGGKALSAVTGVVFLVCVVRATPAAQYGVFVVLLALLEVFYLASGFGLSTMAQRYVAEFRLRAPRAQFQGFVWMLMRRRLGLAVLGAALVGFLWPTLMGLLRLDLPTNTRGWVLLWLIVGCGTRYLDEVLPALLLQAASQLLSILTNLLRLGCLLAVTVLSMALDHQSLVIIELGVASVTGLCGLIWLRLYLLASAASAANTAAHHNPVMWAVSMRFFVVQLLGQGWSPNMARMLVSRIAGGAHTASFGFSLALVDMLRNYLPTYLLASWVRPLIRDARSLMNNFAYSASRVPTSQDGTSFVSASIATQV